MKLPKTIQRPLEENLNIKHVFIIIPGENAAEAEAALRDVYARAQERGETGDDDQPLPDLAADATIFDLLTALSWEPSDLSGNRILILSGSLRAFPDIAYSLLPHTSRDRTRYAPSYIICEDVRHNTWRYRLDEDGEVILERAFWIPAEPPNEDEEEDF